MKYFTIKELCHSDVANKKGIPNNPDQYTRDKLRLLIETVLDPIREVYGKPITVSSGYRCDALNKAVGGVYTSQHKKGEAADIVGKSKVENKRIFDIANGLIKAGKITVGQLIDEKNFSWVHISLPDAKHKNQVFKQ